MNYPLPTLRPWQTSNSNPLSTLASQSLSLQTSSRGKEEMVSVTALSVMDAAPR